MTTTLAWVFGDEPEGLEWSLVLATFPPDGFAVLGLASSWRPHRGQVIRAEDLSQVATEADVVVLAPVNGAFVQGVVPLPEFVHPENALYVFGADDAHFDAAILGGRQAQFVFVPTAGDLQLHSYAVAMLVMYDRQVKRG